MNRIFCGFIALLASTLTLFAQSLDEPHLVIRTLAGNQVQISWPNNITGFVLEASDSLSSDGVWSTVLPAPSQAGTEFVVTITPSQRRQFLRLHQQGAPPVTYLTSTSPLNGETGVAVTRETIVTFSTPLTASTVISSNAFYATFGERRILSRIELSSDHTKASLFYLEPLPGSARIVVLFDGSLVFDQNGMAVDADDDDLPGGEAIFTFDSLSLSPLSATAVIGTVYAAEPVPGATGSTNKPLAGVTITVDGKEQELRTVTDANGNFKLAPVPPGRFFVHIDGRTVVDQNAGLHYPDKSYYPFVGKAWEAVAGREDNQAGGTGKIYLPLIVGGTLQPVSMTSDTVVVFPTSIVAANPALAGVSVTVPANSLFNDNGTRGGKLGIAPVPPDRLPGPLPDGVNPPIVITVQTDGALNFDRPAAICFPNLPDPVLGTLLPAGSKQALISFNHKKGIWEPVASMTVSADGKFICTDPGQGIQQPGWHGVAPPPSGPPNCNDLCCPDTEDDGTLITARPISALDTSRKRKKKKPKICKPEPCKIARYLCEGPCQDRDRICDAGAWKAFSVCLNIVYKEDCAKGFDNSPKCPGGMRRCEDILLALRTPACRKAKEDCVAKCKDCPLGGDALLRSKAINPLDAAYDQISARLDKISQLLLPFIEADTTIPSEIYDQAKVLQQEADALAGGDVPQFLNQYIKTKEDALDAATSGSEQEFGNAPDYPVLYMADILQDQTRLTLRGQTDPYGQYSLFVPRNGELLSVTFYDPLTKRIGLAYPSLQSGPPYRLPRFTVSALDPSALDVDHDGLPDAVELVYGTDPFDGDSDADGILDGAEIEQGTNPLSGLVTQTGVIGTVKTTGAAIDVTTGDDLAVTAEGNAGISVLSLTDPLNPKVIVHLDTPGSAQRVALSDNHVAIADGAAGLAIADIADPVSAGIVQQLNFGTVQSVGAGGGVAYAGLNSGQIISVELGSSLILGSLQLGTDAIQDLALEGDYLYALTRDRLHVISLPDLTVRGSTGSPFPATQNTRLFVGGGIAYTVHGKGYNTLDLSDPTKPFLLTAGNTAQVGWRQLVANGSGMGIAVVGPNAPDSNDRNVSLYDLSSPRTNNIFLTTFPTPGNARAASIYKALAYVADDSAGVQVVNYLPYDNQHVPPAITLTTSADAIGLQEGNPARVTARVSDDVQVRNVEFYVDGAKVFTDGSFPFEYRLVAPLRTPTKSSVAFRARAFDTGGNSTWSSDLTLSLVPDTTAPRIVQVSPIGGGRAVTTVLALFNEPVDRTTLNSTSFRVFDVGQDGQSGTIDDVPITGGTVSFTPETRVASLAFSNPLPDGSYRAAVTTAVTDLAHNHLTADYSWEFRVADAVFWSKDRDGIWNDPLNWSTGAVPGPDDNVVIDSRSADITVTISGRTNLFKNLDANERVLAVNAILQPSGEIRLGKSMTIDRSTVRGGTITAAGGAKLLCINNIPSTLDGVTVNGEIDVTTQLARLFIRNGLKLNGTILIDRAGNLTFPGTQTLPSGTIVCGALAGGGGIFYNSLTVPDNNATLTFGPGVVLRGNVVNVSGNGTLANQGLISADTAQGPITIGTRGYTNSGTNECRNGGSLTINATTWSNTGLIRTTGSGALTFINSSWTNTGIIEVNESTINLGGTFTLTQLGSLRRSGGTVKLTGVLNLAGDTLALNATTGSWIMDRGTINGGTVTLSDGAKLICINNIPSTLNSVTLDGDLDLTSQLARVFIRNGLNISGSVLIDRGGNLTFAGNQTLASGNIVFGGQIGGGLFQNGLTVENNTTLTLGPAVVVRGKLATFNGPGTLRNEGLISADTAGGTLSIAPARFTNAGTSECRNGGSLTLTAANWDNSGTLNAFGGGTLAFQDSWTNTGTINVDGAVLDLAGTFTLASLGILKRANGTVKITGTLDLTGDTLDLNAATGSWQLEHGTVIGGTIRPSEGSRLLIISDRSSTLDGVTINGDLDVTSTLARVVIRHGLNITGNVGVDRGGNLTFDGTQTFSTGSISFGGLTFGFFSNTVTINNGTVLTLGPAAVLHGKTVTISGQGSLVNQGLISCDVAGGNFRIDVGQFTNTGTIEEKNGGKVVIVP